MNETEKRKLSHIKVCLEKDVQSRFIKAGFEEIHLVHRALPETNREDIDTSTKLFGHPLSVPIFIAPMTGGTKKAAEINAALAEAADRLKIAMGVGSQRVAIENPDLAYTFKVARERAPHIFLMANLGCPQLIAGYGVKEAQEAIKMIEADALAIHLNPLQETVQPGGQAAYQGALEKIGEIVHAIAVPVMAKETGAGIAAEEAKALESVGVRGIDVSGVGGTSWAAVEYYRAKEYNDKLRMALGETFWDWGIPTVASIVEVKKSTKLTVMASGGIRTGLDVAKAIALGADVAGLALPLLKPAFEGTKEIIEKLQIISEELKTAMFLSGARNIEELKRVPVVITGKIAEWLRSRGFHPEEYARRGR